MIQIAQPLRVREELARAAALRVAIPLLLLLPVLGGAIVGVVRSGLKPLKRVAIEVQRRNVHSLTPIGAARLPEEVAPLVHELNRLLERLNAAFQTQRAFIADAAHELRSPLTAVRLDLQLLDRAPDEAARRVARANLGAAVDRAIHLLEQLLALARNEPRDEQDELSQIPLEAAAAAASRIRTRWRWRGASISVWMRTPRLWCSGDPDALRTLVRNLVDNAVRYTPEGGRVSVRIHGTPLPVRCWRWPTRDPGSRHRIGSAPSTGSIGEPIRLRAAADWGSPS